MARPKVNDWVIALQQIVCRPFINGAFTNATSNIASARQILNPATNDSICTVQDASLDDVDLAVRSARQALRGNWRSQSGRERRDTLLRMATALESHADDLAHIESMNCGKPWKDSTYEVA